MAKRMISTLNVPIVIVASGSGSTADVIMDKYGPGKASFITQVGRKKFLVVPEVVFLVSTSAKAKCLQRAKDRRVPAYVLEEKGNNEEWNLQLRDFLQMKQVRLLVLAGCVKEVTPIPRVLIVNTHPADTRLHGGRKMYGLAVHRHVLAHLRDEIAREMLSIYFAKTIINFHYVIEGMDKGDPISQTHVDVPFHILDRLIKGRWKLGEAAKHLQKHVLQYEYAMLPSAVHASVLKVIDAFREGRISLPK